MLNIVLVEPEIPPNCGNIARTCAATGSRLHLVEVEVHPDLSALFQKYPQAGDDLWLATTKAPRDYTRARFSPDCWLFFGKETAGLPLDFREQYRQRCIRIPMIDEARSLNLANSAAILIYEALRQNGFPGLLGVGEMGNSSM